ncbi:hypothetical protein M405DRAFT_848153 [Rhizopogon salebrosus TDB-379]|nr:hypothetical protein M405DRAFT_848193 [Rhizopogon salebrosus TDB-379]KAJ8579564.1 hypothetical protein M405DRAFT_848153 [Rhizopogon salebrosus TDB-379]
MSTSPDSITGTKAGLFVLVKRFVSRGLRGKEFVEKLDLQIAEASDDLLKQAAHLFLRPENKDQDSVLVIAATGPFWCNTTINCGHVKNLMHRFSLMDPTYKDPTEHVPDPDVGWSKMLRLDIARSNDRLHTIYKSLKGMGVLEVPADG